MNAYELADIIEDDMEDGFGMGFLKDAVSMLRQQADRIAELEKQCAKYEELIASWNTPQTKPLSKPEECKDGCPKLQVCDYCQQTKPLSNDEILEMTIWNKNLYELYVEMEKEDMIAFARAIEERHGIK